ncbi:MAG: DUF4159 domain-containing protein [Candidatus Poribacteria bacterium]|nr:DUF4159 domain-containing protein [Candidatus Poribacteria bacterium]
MRMILILTILVIVFTPTVLLDGENDSDLFTFVRLKYGGQLTRRSSWRVDYPASDRNFIWQLRKQTNINADPYEKIIEVGSGELFEYPFAYMLEVGSLRLSRAEAKNLREYLLRGGFIFIDDFHGEREWKWFYTEFKKIFPKREPVDIPISHPIFQCFFKIDKLMQIPGLRSLYSGRTYERFDGYPAYCRGVYDDRGRLMMMINFNTDLGDAWEHAAEDLYPREYSDMALKMGINAVVYALTH